MRAAVPAHLPVTVKVRLGWDSSSRSFEIADAVQQAGASELTVHGRTKEDGYKADRINWAAIGEIRQRLSIPVIANGEIWDYQSAQDCLQATGCDAIMLGRGALNVPNLSRVVKYNEPRMPWPQVVELLQNTSIWKSRATPACITWHASNSGWAICAKNMTKPPNCLAKYAR